MSMPFKPKVYQGRGRPLNNFSRGDQRYNNRNRSYIQNTQISDDAILIEMASTIEETGEEKMDPMIER